MNISINFEGLNKILCKLGLHRWAIDGGYITDESGKIVIIDKLC